MKSKKLLISVTCTTKKFYLQPPPKGRNDWHVRFTPPRHSGAKIKRVYQGLGTNVIATAKERARDKIEAFWRAGEAGKAADGSKLRGGFCKLGDVVRLYRKGARSIADKEGMKEQTINGNVGRLRALVRHAGEMEELSSAVLTAETIDKFRATELAPARDNPVALESKRRSVNATIRQARSIFALDYMPLYRSLCLPDLTGFRRAKLCKVSRAGTRYVPIAQAVIDAMEAEIRGLRESRPDLYLAFRMMLWLGMRLGEVEEARLEWIEPGEAAALMVIKPRSYYRPKGIPGAVSIAPALLAELRTLSGATAPLDYLIPAPNPTERHNQVGRELSAIIRRHVGPGRRKTCHELRKHAVSMSLMRTRSYVDALKFSRHSDVRTLQEHYGSFLDELAPIESSDWRAVSLAAR